MRERKKETERALKRDRKREKARERHTQKERRVCGKAKRNIRAGVCAARSGKKWAMC